MIFVLIKRFDSGILSGTTPLLWSSVSGHLEVCQFLVQNRADVNAKDNKYDTQPYACTYEHSLIALFLFATFLFWHSQWKHPAYWVFFWRSLGGLPVSRREWSRRCWCSIACCPTGGMFLRGWWRGRRWGASSLLGRRLKTFLTLSTLLFTWHVCVPQAPPGLQQTTPLARTLSLLQGHGYGVMRALGLRLLLQHFHLDG